MRRLYSSACMQCLLMGTMTHTGVLMSKAVYRPNDTISAKFESRIDPVAYDQVIYMADVDYTGADWTAQLKRGMGGFYGVNCMVAVTPAISGGAEAFYLAQQRRSGLGIALRATGTKTVATAQVLFTFLPLTPIHSPGAGCCLQAAPVDSNRRNTAGSACHFGWMNGRGKSGLCCRWPQQALSQ
jgi:hypothetical protein